MEKSTKMVFQLSTSMHKIQGDPSSKKSITTADIIHWPHTDGSNSNLPLSWIVSSSRLQLNRNSGAKWLHILKEPNRYL